MYCPFNQAVDCDKDNRNCDKCGWNPDVDKERKEKTRERLKDVIVCDTQ